MSAFLTALQRGRIQEAEELEARKNRGVKSIDNPFLASDPLAASQVNGTGPKAPSSFKGLNTPLTPSAYKEFEAQAERARYLQPDSNLPATPNKNYSWGATAVNAVAHSVGRATAQLGSVIQNELRGDGDIENFSLEQREAANAYEKFNTAQKARNANIKELHALMAKKAIDPVAYENALAEVEAEYNKAKLSPEHMKILSTPVTKKVGGYGNNSSAMKTVDTGMTVAEATAKAIQARAHKEKIAGSRDGSVDNIFGTGALVNKAAMDRYNRDVERLDRRTKSTLNDGEDISAAQMTANRLQAAGRNPKATVGSFLESSIYMVPGVGQVAAGLDTNNMYDNSKQSSLDSVGGGLFLDAEDQKRVNKATAFYGALNTLSAGVAGKMVSSSVAKTLGKDTAEKAGTNILTRDLFGSLKNTRKGRALMGAAVIGGSAIGEGFEEFSQDVAEQIGGNQEIDLGSAISGGVLGAFGGAAIGTATQTAPAVRQAMALGVNKAGERILNTETMQNADKAKNATFDNYMDRDHKWYEPAKPIDDIKLSTKATDSLDSIKTKQTEADGILQRAKENLDFTTANIETLTTAEQNKVIGTERLAKVDAAIIEESQKPASEYSETRMAELTEAKEALTESLVNIEETITQLGRIDALKAKNKQMLKAYNQANVAHTEATKKLSKFADKQASKQTSYSDNGVTNAEAAAKSSNIRAKSLFSRLLRSPRDVSQAEIDSVIAESTDENEIKLLRELSEVRIAENAVKDDELVSKDIFSGNREQNYVGLPQYDELVDSAIEKNDVAAYNKAMDMLDNFSASHTSKQEAVNRAQANPDGFKNPAVMRIDGTLDWEVVDRKLSKAERLKYGALQIHKGSTKLVNTINNEADVITRKRNVLRELGEYQFNPENAANQAAPVSAPKETKKSYSPKASTATTKSKPIKVNSNNPKSLSESLHESHKDSAPFRITDAKDTNSGNFEGVGKNRKKVTDAPDYTVKALENLSKDSNMFIGFGNTPTITNFKKGFSGAFNISVSHPDNPEAVYTPEDNVLVFTLAAGKNPSDESIKEAGVSGTSDVSKARKLEIDNAIKGGSTITLLNEKNRQSKAATPVRDIAEYLTKKGYVEGKRTTRIKGVIEVSGNGVFTPKGNEDVKETETTKAPVTTNSMPANNSSTPTTSNSNQSTGRGTKESGKTEPVEPVKKEEKPTVKETTQPEEIAPVDTTLSTIKGQRSPSRKNDPRVISDGLYEDQWVHVEVPAITIENNPALENKSEDSEVNRSPRYTVKGVKDTLTFTQGNSTLAYVGDFFTNIIRTKAVDKMQELMGGEKVTTENIKQLDAFIRLHEIFREALDNAYMEVDPKGTDSNLATILVNKQTGIFDENVVTALTVSAFQYIQKAGHTTNMTPMDVKYLLGMDKKAKLSDAVYNRFKNVGNNRTQIFQELGQNVTGTLAIRATDLATVSEKNQLDVSIGQMIYHVLNESSVDSMMVQSEMTVREKLMFLADSGMRSYDLSKAMEAYYPGLSKEALSMDDLKNLINSNGDFNKSIYFARPNIKHDKVGDSFVTTYQRNVLDIIKSSEREDGSVDIIDKLFGNDRMPKAPLLEMPTEFTQIKIKGTVLSVPENQKQMLLKASQNPWAIQQERADVVINLYDNDRDSLYGLLGIGTASDLEGVHPIKKENKMAEWEITKRSIDDKVSWLKSIKDETGKFKNFYMKPVVWLNQRVGYESTLFNAQTNLFDRMLTSMEAWKTTVKTDEQLFDADGKTTKHGRYLRALAENMEGVSSLLVFNNPGANYGPAARTVDKVASQDFLPAFKDYIDNNEELSVALDAAKKMMTNQELSKSDVQTIKDAVDLFKMDEPGLGALMELVKYRDARTGNNTLETMVGTQSDGVTNGPVTTQVLYAVANAQIMSMGGLLSNDDESYFDQKRRGDVDLYEYTAAAQKSALETYIGDSSILRPLVDMFVDMDNTYGTRKGAKTLVTPFNYGAGLAKLKVAIQDSFISKIEDTFYDLYSATPEVQGEKLLDLNRRLYKIVDNFNNINTYQEINEENLAVEVEKLVYIYNHRNIEMIPLTNVDGTAIETAALVKTLTKKFDVASINDVNKKLRFQREPVEFSPITLEELEGAFPARFNNAINEVVGLTWGTASAHAVKQTSLQYILQRDEVTLVSNTAFEVYNELKKDYISKVGKPEYDLTVGQKAKMEKDLMAYRPALVSALGNDNVVDGKRTGGVKYGLMLSKDSKINLLGDRVKSRYHNLDTNSATRDKQYSAGFQYTTEIKPGVRGMALQIQAVDSYVSVNTVAEQASINLHDANMGSLDNFEAMAQAQNKAHFQAMINYDAYVETLQALLRPINGIEALMNNVITKGGSTLAVKVVLNKGYGKSEDLTLSEYLSGQVESAYSSDIAKLRAMAEVKVHHQYAGENGQYEVTDADRAAIQARIEKLEDLKAKEVERISKQIASINSKLTIYENNLKDDQDTRDYVELNNAVQGNKNLGLKDIIDNAKVLDVNTVLSYIKNSLKGGTTENLESIVGIINSINDTAITSTKIRVVDNTKSPVSYDKLRDTIVLQRGSPNVNIETVARIILQTALHKNMLAYKKGSNKSPFISEQIRALTLLSNSSSEYFERAYGEGHIDKSDLDYLNATIGKHRGNAEYLMDFAMHNKRGIEILKLVPFYEDTTTKPESFLRRVVGFINNIMTGKIGAVRNMHEILLTNSYETINEIITNRRDKTIAEVIEQSYTTHKNEFHREFNLSELNYWDTRINHEIYKAKIKNGGKPLKANTVLDIIENGLVNGLDSSNVNNALYTEAYLPIIKLLKTTLKDSTKIVIIDNIDDLAGTNISEESKSELAMTGDAFFVDGTAYLFTPASSTNPNTKMSTILHELIHAATKYYTSNPSTSRSMTKLSALYESIKADMSKVGNHPDVIYAATNLDEFLANGATLKPVQDFLESHGGTDAFYKAWASDLGANNKESINALTVFNNLLSEFQDEHKERDYESPQQKAFTDIARGLRVPAEEANNLGPNDSSGPMLNTEAILEKGKAALFNFALNVTNNDFIDTYNRMMGETSQVEDFRDLTEQLVIEPALMDTMLSAVTDKGSLLQQYFESFGPNGNSVYDILKSVSESTVLRSPRNSNAQTSPNGFRFSPRDIFDFLGTTETNDTVNLDLNMALNNVVEPLLDSIDAKLLEGYQLYKVWQDAVMNGDAVFVTDAYAAGFNLTDQEGFVLETAQVALNNILDEVTDKKAYNDIRKLYQDAKRVLQPSDFHEGNWNQATLEEQEMALRRYNYVFNTAVSSEDKSDYLTRFIALGLASQQFKDIMNRTVSTRDRSLGFKDTVLAIMKDVVMWVYNLKNLLPGAVDIRDKTLKNDTMKVKLAKLSETLVQVYNKHNDVANESRSKALEVTSDLLEGITDVAILATTNSVKAIANMPYLQRGVVGKVTQLVAADAHEKLPGFIDATFNNNNETLNEASHVIGEIIGTDSSEVVRRVKDFMNAGKFIEQTRQKLAETTASAIMDYFHKDNKNMSMDQRKAVTKVLLRTDLQSLLRTKSYDEVIELVRSPTKLNTEIKRLEGLISQDTHGNEYLIRSKGLADYLVNREGATNNMLAKNAYSIAYRFGMSERPENVPDSLINQIDDITSLYALKATKAQDKQHILDLHAKEIGPINGLDFTLRTHQTIARKTDELFKLNPWAKNKGYLPNITNPNKGFEVVNAWEVESYIKQGYVKADELRVSELDDTEAKVLMILPHTGKQRYVSGAISIQDTAKSGTVILTRQNPEFKGIVATIKREFDSAVRTGNYQNYSRDVDTKGLIPSYNDRGEIVSLSYEMGSVGLDTYLERNNDFLDLLGHYAGGTHAGLHNPEHNKKTIDYLIEVFDTSDKSTRGKFVEVSANSPHAKAREYWHSLPREIQMYIEEQTGEQELHIRNDMLNILFGFSKYTPSQIFNKDFKDRNVAEKIYAGIFNAISGQKAQLRSNQVIGLWQELISLLKDFEVVRSIDVFVGNILSNIALAMVNDFDPLAMAQDIGLATESSLAYYRDSSRISAIELTMANGYSNASLLSEYAELKDSIARNPLKDFIEAGMMPTIVNDVSFAKDEFSYKSNLTKRLEKMSSKVPGGISTAAKNIIVSPDTGLYQFLATATQQSDFVFKYAVYKQELKAGKTKEEAMRLAREMFIEYDVPTSKGMQFVNDMGVFMYTKFAFRIQRVIAYLIKKRGPKIFGEAFITPMLFGIPSIMSLHLASKAVNGTNPLRMPIDDVLTMIDEAAPLALILDILGLSGNKFNI